MNQFLVLTTALGLSACGDSATAIVTEPAGAHCPNGGVAIESGDSTTYVCDGSDGSDGSNASSITWTTISADTTAQASHGYIVDATGPVTLTLPATQGLDPGDEVRLIVRGTGSVDVSPNAAQTFDYDPGQLGWRPSPSPGAQWQTIAMSADATAIFATSQTGVYRSRDAGVTWIPLPAGPHQYLEAIAVSANGQVVVAGAYQYGIFFSTDAGTTWSQPVSGGPAYVLSIAISADGSTMFATDQQTQTIHYSTDSGANWSNSSIPAGYYVGLACSADGSNAVAIDQYGAVYRYTSTSGVWNQIASFDNGKIASSADGATLVVTSVTGEIHVSHDAGVTWSRSDAPTRQWYSVAMSTDGRAMISAASSYGGDASGIAMSKDAGVTWSIVDGTTRVWQGVAISGDGTIPIAIDAASGSIYHRGNGSVLATRSTELDFMYEGNGAFFATSVAGAAYGPY